MINLLPDDAKAEIRAARTNITLVGYLTAIGLAIAFLGLICSAVYLMLMNTQAAATAVVAENTSKTTAYSSIRSQADNLKASLASAKIILDKEVDYPKTITGIANAMPAGVVLDNLTLSPATFGVPITLQAYAKTSADAIRLKENFQRSALFSNVTFVTLTSDTKSAANGYPVSISMSLTLNKAVSP